MKTVESLIRDVFNQPTAPYRETWVLNLVKSELRRMKIPFVEDSWGNIIAGIKNADDLKNSNRVGIMAHTDHPGFHLVKKSGKKIWIARWFGGAPPKIKGAKVAISNPALPHVIVRGKILSTKFEGKDHHFKIEIKDKQSAAELLDTNCFGAFDFAGFKKVGTRIKTRAADDLTGVAIILGTLERLKPNERKHIFGVFTRAEEVGFRGALGIIYSNSVGKRNSIISLEASRQLPGARIGQGPVIRLGDKRTLFDSSVTNRLDQAAEHLKKHFSRFQFQRRIMNGGTCEATPFNLHNIKASGIAVPLGNYHNQRPDGKPGAEFVDIRDVAGAIELCVEFYRHMAQRKDPVADFLLKLKKDFAKDVKFLKKKVKFSERAI